MGCGSFGKSYVYARITSGNYCYMNTIPYHVVDTSEILRPEIELSLFSSVELFRVTTGTLSKGS